MPSRFQFNQSSTARTTAHRLCLLRFVLLLLACATPSTAIFGQSGNSRERIKQAVSREQSAQRPNILFAIADDWSYPHAGIYGDKVVKTPNFDQVAREGALFTRAFCVSPSCTPSRASVLTGQTIHRLEEGANLWGILPKKFPVYPDVLESAGYYVGYTGKGWDPGVLKGSGRTRNPAGPEFNNVHLKQPKVGQSNIDYVANFKAFLKDKPRDAPFCFWFGSHDPHRRYAEGSGLQSGMKLKDVVVPPFLPDIPEVRSDLLDYYFEVQRFDRDLGEILKLLDAAGQLDNTIVVVTSDNGMPFLRAKTNLYDAGTHLPLAVRWSAHIKPGRVIDTFISFTDFAPTFLEAARLKPVDSMSGRSFLRVLTGETRSHRDLVFMERERHDGNARVGNLSYPVRAVRTKEFLYIRNLRPERNPHGDSPKFGDFDVSAPTNKLLLFQHTNKNLSRYFHLATDKRPAEELYDVRRDPTQLTNLAARPSYAATKNRLRAALDRWMKETADPRAFGSGDAWDSYPYFTEQDRRKEGRGFGNQPAASTKHAP